MQEPPPPYPGALPASIQANTHSETCRHHHLLLATHNISPYKPIDSPTTMFHHWPCREAFHHTQTPSPKSLSIPSNIPPSSLQHISSFRDLGTFLLSITNFSQIHPHLTSLLTPSNQIPLQSQCSPPPDDEQIISNLLLQLTQQTPSALAVPAAPDYDRSTIVQLFLSRGFLEASVDDTIVDGEWNAGRGLRLLVSGATGEEVRGLREAGAKVVAG
ncbi:hypothetical protein AJ79_04306 [Helicocarpus griseus UAMH5409]|uniref:Uncharacterized protein n=1 Tax=Helicocarpus griseus UAMH5409 TaxID=1447875 RepID=A0A2B7XUV5_9EURO|nr:hypothetical protein AJ79_04306 [Helicocarpus griseus UAMH5409]